MNVMSYAKRLTALLLCAVLLLGLMPVGAFAAENEGETTAPTGETTTPTGETTAPTGETTTPTGETTAPTGETTAPTEAPVAQIDETGAPTDETTEPAEGDNAGVPDAQANNDDGTTTVLGSVTTVENAYVLTNTVSHNGTYLIVNTNAAGQGYALLNNNGSISAVEVTVVQSDDGPCISLDNSSAVWTFAASGSDWLVSNNGSYLVHPDDNLGLSSTGVTWATNGTNLYYHTQFAIWTTNYYLTGGSNWSIQSSREANVYFYAPADSVTVTVPDVTYGITVTANGTTDNYTAEYVTKGQTLALSTAFWSNPTGYEANANGGTYAWTSSDENVATVAQNGTLSFTGKAGSTTVRVTYTLGEYVIWDEIVITAEPAGYKVQIVDGEKNSIDGTFPVKGDTAIAAGLDLNALVTNETSATESAEVTNAVVKWSVSDTSIAAIDTNGKLTFTGKEGVITVTVSYTDPDGGIHEDTLNVSVSKSEYFTPNDGTNDFPEYPNEGAVRIDKNAQAVGNFSETGVAKVELSMTGVPYSTNNEIDVVIMVDMSTSMNQSSNGIADRVTPAKNAVIAALNAIVKNEDGSYNNNRVAIYTFAGSLNPRSNGYCDLQTFDAAAVTSMTSKINSWRTDSATNYQVSLEKCQTVLAAAKQTDEGKDRQQFCIFITDGSPSSGFAYLNDQGGVTKMDIYEDFSDSEVGTNFVSKTEYYSYMMKQAGVNVYSIGVQMFTKSGNSTVESTNCKTLLKKIAGTKDGDATTTANAGYARFVEEDVSVLTTIFQDIVNEIKQAATNVTVTDKITDEYTLILDAPNATVGDALGDTALTIDVIEYTLDANKNRVLPGTVIESVSMTDSTKVSKDADGNLVINAENFTFNGATNIITWKADKLDTKELALSYYVYLENSAGYAPEDQTAAETYPTNEYATIDYTNHLDHQCRKEFPKPQLTWNGAQVSYTFYLVNEQGQPVNRAGRVVPFAEAVYVTDVYTESVTWDTDADKKLDANLIANDLLPDVYQLFDNSTKYTINVYEDEEGKDLGNHFIIENGEGVTTNTTKVFNTKAGTIYSAPGTYTATGNNDTTKVHTGFDFANTTVAFAVVWKSQLVPDTVVLDYGLDVIIDVTENDALEAKVVGVRADAPTGVTMNSGNYTAAKAQEIDVKVGDVVIGTATVENLTSVRFSLNKENSMLFNAPVTFYYESEASYYNSDNVLQTVYLYSSVTVIPATTIYYEDEYVKLQTVTQVGNTITTTEDAAETDVVGTTTTSTVYHEDGSYTITTVTIDTDASKVNNVKITTSKTYKAENGWTLVYDEGETSGDTATQAQDRPGKSQISATIDADNNYGYDKAYAEMSEYSMGAAVVANVDTGTYATAEFEFYGTGFDVISLTDNTTGTIVVEVFDANNKSVVKETVNNYYGYKFVDGEWVVTQSGDPNALYQVPVIKIGDGQTTNVLPYGKYKAVITATYIPFLDSNQAPEAPGYNFYLDAIRIYNPTGNQNDTANDAYLQDGEAYPSYFELRDKIIEANTFDVLNAEDNIEGIVFIDGNAEEASVSNYTSYGPNNEVYLAAGQAVSFELSATGPVAKVQIALKSVGGTAFVKIYSADGVTALEQVINTATDMYYDITVMNGKNVVITNNGEDGILSITNVKVTYTSDPNGTAATKFMVRRASVNAALNTMNVVEPEVPETTVPETTVPETEVPETEVPETEVPETEVPETEVPETTEPEETEPETEAPTEKPTEPNPEEVIKKTVGKIIKKIFGWLFG